MAENLEQTKISIENNNKMFVLAEREGNKSCWQETNVVNLKNVKPILSQK